ncbi:hypothetical protein [Patiriisocius hiemis]|uniref:NERD domain-containing protein n=1 Tax=Patiriisocius hiemis TaxID=3075604 RepID=A0ABU2Y8M6_9FLAO|nr:hypothetical protein [Constantimarinum sp. W242]MDT0554397.1 hypothetical protein [Constantimarinum sp. W242]
MGELLPILAMIFIAVIIYFGFVHKTKREKEHENHLRKRLSDEFIIDPESGAKLSLEQAESGHWINHNNEYLEKYDNHPTEEEKEVEKTLNYLRRSKEYRKQKLTSIEIELLEKTKILSKYDDWSYSSPFEIQYCKGYIFHPAVLITGQTYYDNDYHESQIMFWTRLDFYSGHYYLREKSTSEKFFDLIRNDDDLKIDNFEVFTFEKTQNLILINNILKFFKSQKDLEIEFYKENLFIKNRKLINMEDLTRIESIVKSLSNKFIQKRKPA